MFVPILLFSLANALIGGFNLGFFLTYTILLFFLIIFYEMIIHFNPERGLSAVAKALTKIGLAQSVSSFIPTVESQQVNKQIKAGMYKANSVFKILMNTNRGILYLVFFLCLMQAFNSNSETVSIALGIISTYILIEIGTVMPLLFSLVVFDKLADIVNALAQLARF